MSLFKIRVKAPIWHRPKDETDKNNITYRKRTHKFRTDTVESVIEYAKNLRMYWGCEILWIKEVLKDGTEKVVEANAIMS